MSKNVFDISNELQSNAYPGRGIIFGRTPDDKRNVVAYFIMGRSENSRARVFVETEDGIRTQAYDPAKLTDPSLVIYHSVRQCGGKLVVTNGDQTDTICDFLRDGKSYIDALRTRQFEPDPPNYTARISGVINEDGSYSLSILKNFTSDRTANKRFFYEYDKPVAGLGHFLHTYQCDGDPLPPFRGEPKCIRIEKPIEAFTDMLWDSMNEQNKVALFVRYIDLATGTYQQQIRNKHEEGEQG
ncbi:MAG: IMP cyclohydrolase [Eubacteriales bacterium]|nr:IMP cyclohydrolase [Eubacteriales bacterium]